MDKPQVSQNMAKGRSLALAITPLSVTLTMNEGFHPITV